MYLTHPSAHTGRSMPPCKTFTFSETDLQTINEDRVAKQASFVCLVCGDNTVCILTEQDTTEVIDFKAKVGQWITIELPPKASMRVKGSAGTLSHTVAHNAFPNIVFQ